MDAASPDSSPPYSRSSSRSSSPERGGPSPAYGSIAYWDERYRPEGGFEPYDWLFSFEDVRETLEALLPDKSVRILVPGCGDAPFSAALYDAGYHNSVFCDLSQVVISKQQARFPHMTWHVQDVMHMTYPDGSFGVVLDKSLIDTLLCFTHAQQCTSTMMTQIRRVLQPGGLYVTLSLHTPDEVSPYLSVHDWAVSMGRLKNPAHDPEHRERSVAHTIAACRIPALDGTPPTPPELVGLLTREGEDRLRKEREDAAPLDKVHKRFKALKLGPRVGLKSYKGMNSRRAVGSLNAAARARAHKALDSSSIAQMRQSLWWALKTHSANSRACSSTATSSGKSGDARTTRKALR